MPGLMRMWRRWLCRSDPTVDSVSRVKAFTVIEGKKSNSYFHNSVAFVIGIDTTDPRYNTSEGEEKQPTI